MIFITYVCLHLTLHYYLYMHKFRTYTHFERVSLNQKSYYSLVYTLSIGRYVKMISKCVANYLHISK